MTESNGPAEEVESIKSRLTPDEFKRLAEQARKQGEPITDLVKRFALDSIEEVFEGLETDESEDADQD